MRIVPLLSVLPAAAGLIALAGLKASASGQWDAGKSGTNAGLRAVHSAGPGVAWAGGAHGVILRSEDDGYLWQPCAVPPDAAHLDFRGIWGWSADRALALASGPGSASRLYETTDGCAHWHLNFANPDAAGFWDAIVFRNEKQGVLLGDPVNGRFVILRTEDGGKHWSPDQSAGLQTASPGESVFAASNSALTLGPRGTDAFFVTGGPGGGRIFHFRAGAGNQPGRWTSVRVPFTYRSQSAGLFSIAFRDARHGVTVGGDYRQPSARAQTAAWTADGGASWAAAANPPTGYRSAVAWDGHLRVWIAVGPDGSDCSRDDGETWQSFDNAGWNALGLPWAVGPLGRIGKLNTCDSIKFAQKEAASCVCPTP